MFEKRQLPPQPSDTPDQMDVMLAPLRTPATIRDIKQSFLYAQRLADLRPTFVPSVNPLVFVSSGETNAPNASFYLNYTGGALGTGVVPPFNWNVYPCGKPTPPDAINRTPCLTPDERPYLQKSGCVQIFDRIGTEFKLDISRSIADLWDIRIPADKVLIEISLVECQIDSDPGNYNETFDQQYINPNPLDFKLNRSVPQTLYVRIRELDNAEPYNFAVTNSGQYSNDRNHSVLLRFGQINYTHLTIDYGHLAMGIQNAQQELLKVPYVGAGWPVGAAPDPLYVGTYGVPAFPGDAAMGQPSQVVRYSPVDVDNSHDANNNLIGNRIYPLNTTYYDYNSAWFVPPPKDPMPAPLFPPEFYDEPLPRPVEGKLNRELKPLFYNQQATNITFRFMVKFIHLF